MPVANTWVVGTRSWYAELFGANKCGVVFVACPATVKEGIESERKVGRREHDEVKIAEKE